MPDSSTHPKTEAVRKQLELQGIPGGGYQRGLTALVETHGLSITGCKTQPSKKDREQRLPEYKWRKASYTWTGAKTEFYTDSKAALKSPSAHLYALPLGPESPNPKWGVLDCDAYSSLEEAVKLIANCVGCKPTELVRSPTLGKGFHAFFRLDASIEKNHTRVWCLSEGPDSYCSGELRVGGYVVLYSPNIVVRALESAPVLTQAHLDSIPRKREQTASKRTYQTPEKQTPLTDSQREKLTPFVEQIGRIGLDRTDWLETLFALKNLGFEPEWAVRFSKLDPRPEMVDVAQAVQIWETADPKDGKKVGLTRLQEIGTAAQKQAVEDGSLTPEDVVPFPAIQRGVPYGGHPRTAPLDAKEQKAVTDLLFALGQKLGENPARSKRIREVYLTDDRYIHHVILRVCKRYGIPYKVWKSRKLNYGSKSEKKGKACKQAYKDADPDSPFTWLGDLWEAVGLLGIRGAAIDQFKRVYLARNKAYKARESAATRESVRKLSGRVLVEDVAPLDPLVPYASPTLEGLLADMGQGLRHNVRSGRIESRPADGTGPWRQTSDRTAADVLERIALKYTLELPGKGEQIKEAAFECHGSKLDRMMNSYLANHSGDPVLEYLEGLKWDGIVRIPHLLYRLYYNIGPNDPPNDPDPYRRKASELLVGTPIARTYIPGLKVDEMVVLWGPQGTQKSSFWEYLIPQPYRADWHGKMTLTGTSEKQRVEGCRGLLSVEFPDLSRFPASVVEDLKAWGTKSYDNTIRHAYARHAESEPRRWGGYATSNEVDHLPPDVENRRWVSVHCPYKPPMFIGDFWDQWREVVLAEAVHKCKCKHGLYHNGDAPSGVKMWKRKPKEKAWPGLPLKLEPEQRVRNKEHTQQDTYFVDLLRKADLMGAEKASLFEIWQAMSKAVNPDSPVQRPTGPEKTRLYKVLRQCGFKQGWRRGARVWRVPEAFRYSQEKSEVSEPKETS